MRPLSKKERTARVSLSLRESLLADLKAAGARQDRPLSWIIEAAWRCSREKVLALGVLPTIVISKAS